MTVTSIWGVGPICSGKTTLASYLSEELELPLLTEALFPDGLHGITKNVNTYPLSVMEHCELLSFYAELGHHFERLLVFYLDVAAHLLVRHKEQRIRLGGTGGFTDVDPIAMKSDIESRIRRLEGELDIITVQIREDSDYVSTRSVMLSLAGEFAKETGRERTLNGCRGEALA